MSGIVSLILILITVYASYRGFKDRSFYRKYEFEVEKILLYRDYKRLITAGFLHVNWMHLIFNMVSLFFFSRPVESFLGIWQFLLIYFSSMIGGHLLSLFVYRSQGDYTAVGASGAIGGLIFACIALLPGFSVGLFFIPVPGWLFGLLYVTFTIYGIRSRRDNIGHEAHLGGALIGMAVALCLQPAAIAANYITILIIAIPAIVFIYLIITRPHILMVDNFFYNTHTDHYSIDHKYNEGKANQQKEVDRILDKISKKGINSLTQKEKQTLKEYSRN